MRSTINLDDQLLERAKIYARERSLSLEKALSELVRRGLDGPVQTRQVNGLAVFDLPPDSPPVTTEQIRKILAEE